MRLGIGIDLGSGGAPSLESRMYAAGANLWWDTTSGVTIATGVSNWVSKGPLTTALAQAAGVAQWAVVAGGGPDGRDSFRAADLGRQMLGNPGSTSQTRMAFIAVVKCPANGVMFCRVNTQAQRIRSTAGSNDIFNANDSSVSTAGTRSNGWEVVGGVLEAGAFGGACSRVEVYRNGVSEAVTGGPVTLVSTAANGSWVLGGGSGGIPTPVGMEIRDFIGWHNVASLPSAADFASLCLALKTLRNVP